MQDKNTTESTFFQLLGPILSQDLWQKISRNVESVDKYVKKLKTIQLVQLVINAEMQEYTSLDEISNSLNEDALPKPFTWTPLVLLISRRFREMSTDVADIIHKSIVQILGVEDEDALNVFDRGYLEYKQFDYYCREGIRFVTRLKNNACVEVLQELEVDEESVIEEDLIVRLGKRKNRMEHDLRLVITKDTEGKAIMILTNDFDMTAEELGDIYRYRWQIELVFEWIKQHLTIKHLFGKSKAAVVNQLIIALITYCLMMLVKYISAYQGPLLDIQRILITCLYEPFTSFVQKLHRKGPPTKGRQRQDSERVYEETLNQVLSGEMDDLIYSTEIF